MAHRAQVVVIGGVYAETDGGAPGSGPLFVPGGMAARTAALLGRMGCRVFLISAIGKDTEGNEVMSRLRKDGVTVDFLRQLDDLPSLKVGRPSEKPQKVVPGDRADARNRIDRESLLAARAMISSCDAVVITADVPAETFVFGLKISHYYKAPVIVRSEPVGGIPREAFSEIDILVADEEETRELTGRGVKDLSDAAACLRLLLGMGAGAALIMLEGMGVAGAMSLEAPFFVPAPFVGEGTRGWNRPALMGYLARSLAAGVSLRGACFTACAAAALAGEVSAPDVKSLEREILKTTLMRVGDKQ